MARGGRSKLGSTHSRGWEEENEGKWQSGKSCVTEPSQGGGLRVRLLRGRAGSLPPLFLWGDPTSLRPGHLGRCSDSGGYHTEDGRRTFVAAWRRAQPVTEAPKMFIAVIRRVVGSAWVGPPAGWGSTSASGPQRGHGHFRRSVLVHTGRRAETRGQGGGEAFPPRAQFSTRTKKES